VTLCNTVRSKRNAFTTTYISCKLQAFVNHVTLTSVTCM
jgi:hypothetical protein